MITYLQENILTILLWLASIPVTIILTLFFRKNIQPLYAKKSINLTDISLSNIKDVGVFYKGKEVDSFTVTKIVIWNKGKETIRYSDLASKDKLRLSPKYPSEIMDIEILQIVNEINGVEVVKENEEYILKFDFLDTNQGFVLKVFHTGSDSDDIMIKGSFIGYGEIQDRDSNWVALKILMKYKWLNNYFSSIFAAIPFFFIGITTGSLFAFKFIEEKQITIALNNLLLISLVPVLVSFVILFFLRSGRKNVPNIFKSFLNDDF